MVDEQLEQQQYVAAIDLGSNSFHMVITREGEQGGIRIVDKVREMVRLGAGLQSDGSLSREVQDRALACLERFQQRLESIPRHRIRAVGTNTFRAAKNSQEFLKRAECALGHPISIISGHEEARLVYLGAAFDLAVSEKKRLVVDIGGGSTELIVGRGFQPMRMDSLYIGCVSMTRRFFDDGVVTKQRIYRARQVVLRELETVVQKYRRLGWDEVVGTSGTIKAIDSVSRSLGIKQDWISRQGLDAIEKWLLEAGKSSKLDHVSEQRRPVFVGGFVILSTIYNEFSFNRVETSEGALREGVAYDLIDRLHNVDSRVSGVNTLVEQFQPDQKQIARISALVDRFFRQVEKSWKLDLSIHAKLLTWASQLHEIGVAISYSHQHLHSAYIIENSDIDGFSRQVQRILALMVRNSRQKLKLTEMEWLTDDWSNAAIRLTILLRLAITFFRGRSDFDITRIELHADGNTLLLMLPRHWAAQHPLTLFDLETEKEYLSSAKFNLEIEMDELD